PLLELRPAFRRIQLVDAGGRLVASSTRGGRLFNADAAWFKALSAPEGAASQYVGSPFRASSSSTTLYEVAVPVRARACAFVGAARALVDAADLYAVVGPVRIARKGHAVLVRAADGFVLASDESERVLSRPLPGFAALKNALDGFPLGESGQQLF